MPRLADRVGDYENSELSVMCPMEFRDTSFVMRNVRRDTGRLIHAYGKEFRGTAQLTVAFERDAAGRVTGFSVELGDRNRNAKFGRRT